MKTTNVTPKIRFKEHGAFANIPPKANRRWKYCFSPALHRDRNAIERMLCRLEDSAVILPPT